VCLVRVIPKRWSCLALTLALHAPLAAAEDITLINGEWLPLLSEHLPGNGVLSRVVTEAFALEGVTVHYVFRPWPRALAEAEKGIAQGTLVWSKGAPNSARTRNFVYSDVLFEGKSVFFHRTGFAFAWKTYADLARYRIGGVLGYEYDFEGTPGLRIDRGPTEELSMRKLLAGRFDLYPTVREVGMYTLRTHFTAQEAAGIRLAAGRPYNLTRYHLLLPRRLADTPRRMEVFNRGLRRLKESGRYGELMANAEAGRY
jgi:polar amino acid transport system substrate-binding protein